MIFPFFLASKDTQKKFYFSSDVMLKRYFKKRRRGFRFKEKRDFFFENWTVYKVCHQRVVTVGTKGKLVRPFEDGTEKKVEVFFMR